MIWGSKTGHLSVQPTRYYPWVARTARSARMNMLEITQKHPFWGHFLDPNPGNPHILLIFLGPFDLVLGPANRSCNLNISLAMWVFGVFRNTGFLVKTRHFRVFLGKNTCFFGVLVCFFDPSFCRSLRNPDPPKMTHLMTLF